VDDIVGQQVKEGIHVAAVECGVVVFYQVDAVLVHGDSVVK
jgi:hypothetical protein